MRKNFTISKICSIEYYKLMKIIRVENTKDEEAWSLFQKVYETIDNKEYFAFDPNYIPPQQGYTYKLYEGNKLAACFLLTFPKLDSENLGYDINLDEDSLLKVAHMDSAAVDKEFRGNGYQQKLMKMAEHDAINLGYKYLMCTIHPDNKYSMNNALKLGYKVVKTKGKYGGKLRAIMIKEVSSQGSYL